MMNPDQPWWAGNTRLINLSGKLPTLGFGVSLFCHGCVCWLFWLQLGR